MKLKLKGLDLQIFLIIASHEFSIAMLDLNREATYIPESNNENVKLAIHNLEADDFIEKNANQYSFSGKGKGYFNEYNYYGMDEILDGKFDFACLKFLVEMKEWVYFKDFPKSILSKTPEQTKGLEKSWHLKHHLLDETVFNGFFDIDDNGDYSKVKIEDFGIRKYESLKKQETREKRNLLLDKVEKVTNIIGNLKPF